MWWMELSTTFEQLVPEVLFSFNFFVVVALLQTFDECVLNNMTECVDPAKIFYIVPFFCGQESYCR